MRIVWISKLILVASTGLSTFAIMHETKHYDLLLYNGRSHRNLT